MTAWRVAAIVAVVIVGSCATVRAEEGAALGSPISGRWVLDEARSDDAREIAKQLDVVRPPAGARERDDDERGDKGERGGRGGRGGARGGRSSGSGNSEADQAMADRRQAADRRAHDEALATPRVLLITRLADAFEIVDDETHVTFRWSLDGKPHADEVVGEKAKTKASWAGNELVVETDTGEGVTVRRNYSIAPASKSEAPVLQVRTTVRLLQGGRSVSIKRLYRGE